MNLGNILSEALKLSTDTKFKVVINNDFKEMTYLELGMYLVSNSEQIERIEVIIK